MAPAGNRAPVVDAGPNRSVQLGQSASLDGTVTDDGRSAGAVVKTTWAKAAGPAPCRSPAPPAWTPRHSFSAAGIYTLSLTASDTQLSASDTMTVTVVNPTAVTDTFSGSFTRTRRSITHAVSSGPGTITVTASGPSNLAVTATLYAPSGALIGQVSGPGTRSFTVTGPSRETYWVVMSGTSGSYTTTVKHPS